MTSNGLISLLCQVISLRSLANNLRYLLICKVIVMISIYLRQRIKELQVWSDVILRWKCLTYTPRHRRRFTFLSVSLLPSTLLSCFLNFFNSQNCKSLVLIIVAARVLAPIFPPAFRFSLLDLQSIQTVHSH